MRSRQVFGQQRFRPQVVVVLGERFLVTHAPGFLQRHLLASADVDDVAAAPFRHNGVDVLADQQGFVHRAPLRRHDDFLVPGPEPKVPRHRDEHAGKGQAVATPDPKGLVCGQGDHRIVFEVQQVRVE